MFSRIEVDINMFGLGKWPAKRLSTRNISNKVKLSSPLCVASTLHGKVDRVTALVVTGDVDACLQRLQWRPGPWFNIKMSSYQYRKSYCGDKTVVRSSYLHNGISYTGKMSSLYWMGAQGSYISWRPFTFSEVAHIDCSAPWLMMTSSIGNIFRVTGHLCGEFTGPRWISRTKASDAEFWCFLWSAPE